MLTRISFFLVFTKIAYASFSGTNLYPEVEYKFAFSAREKVNYEGIERSLKDLIKTGDLRFSQQFKQNYQFKEEKVLYFYDKYFDDKGDNLSKKQNSLRIRKRLKNFALDSEVSRCEIQLKYNYQEKKPYLSRVNEVRFEFRKDSKPFSLGLPLPPNKCDDDFIQKVLVEGHYLGFKTNISNKLKEKLPEVNISQLSLFQELLTIRHRYHMNIKNPWGKGPNPNQVILITFDQTYNHKGEHSFTEVEIERDRSTFVNLKKPIENSHLLSEIANEARKEALYKLERDFEMVKNTIMKSFSSNPLPLKSKIQRHQEFMESNGLDVREL